MYLGAELSYMTNIYGQECWSISSDNYCAMAVTNAYFFLENHGLTFPKKCITPQAVFIVNIWM